MNVCGHGASVRTGEAIQTSEQGVHGLKPTSHRTVHFLLPGSATPVSSPATKDKDRVGCIPAAQGHGVNSENGQMFDDTFKNGCGHVTPVQQTTKKPATVSKVDGANEREVSVPSSASGDHDAGANAPACDPEDVSRVMKASELINLRAMHMGNGDSQASTLVDDRRPINGPSEELGEDVTMEGSEEVSSELEEAIVELESRPEEHHHEVAMVAELCGTAASTLSPDIDKRNSPVVSPRDFQGTAENIKVVESDVAHRHVDAAPFIESPPKRYLENDHDQPPAKRRRIDTAPNFSTEQSAKGGESSKELAPQCGPRLISSGNNDKAEPTHPAFAPLSSTTPAMTDWSSLTVANLRKQLMKRGLPIKGVKALLVQRLTEHDVIQATKEEERVVEEEEEDGGLGIEEPEPAAVKGKGKGIEQISEPLAGTVNNLKTDTVAAARDREKDVETLVEGLVDDMTFEDDVTHANFLDAEATGQYHHEHHVDEFNSTVAAGSPAKAVLHDDDLAWQDDTYEEVVLLTTPPCPDSISEPEDAIQHEGDADVSLQSVEAPAIEPGLRDGTPPRFTGSGTAWTGLKTTGE
ncbi:hypothetical protein N0V93_008690 [Gnomoniopsis smithogilvyi]|uniref:SAP domain-containing protein n=1 Tax=Gnomoniopsis smithogilvyi TaxID=1191159 RepID=A0A9W8YM55_9PEZI|nr:hypothetical protein N0V93_008690 [Gnomoniopsis smithogilvyi]